MLISLIYLISLRQMKSAKEKLLIGRREFVNFPDFSLQNVEVKVDTGAYTSSIHVAWCKEVSTKEGDAVLEVVFLDPNHPSYLGKSHFFQNFRKKKVKSSNGQDQLRFFIKMKMEMMGLNFITEFSLTERNGLRYPILIGRKTLNRRFIVDTQLKHLSNKLKNETGDSL